MIIVSPFLFCSFLRGCRYLDSSIIVISVGSSTLLNISVVSLSRRWYLERYESFLVYPRDYESSIHKSSLGVSSACCLDFLCILIIEVYDSFGFRQHVFLDAVSCSLCVDAQHRKDFFSCPFDWWCLWCLHFLVSGNLLGLINCVNVVIAGL